MKSGSEGASGGRREGRKDGEGREGGREGRVDVDRDCLLMGPMSFV